MLCSIAERQAGAPQRDLACNILCVQEFRNARLAAMSTSSGDEGDRVFEEPGGGYGGAGGGLDSPQQQQQQQKKQLLLLLLHPSIALPDLFFDFASPSPPISSSPGCRALVSGPPACGKTSLLLQFAYNCAKEDSSSFVTFLCKPCSLDDNPPCLSQAADPESDAFARITIKYIHDDEDLRKYFAAFHLQTSFPRAVIIDDFFDLFNERSCAERFGHIRPRESAMVKTLALCYDAISFAKYIQLLNPESVVIADENSGGGAPCHLLVSDSHVGDAPRLRFIYQRWLLQILTIEALDESTFCVSLGRDDDCPSSKTVKATYSLPQGRLQLDCIEGRG